LSTFYPARCSSNPLPRNRLQIVEVKAQGVGALVRVQAEGRIAVESLKQLQPYIAGAVTPLLDDPVPQDSIGAALKAADELASMLRVGGCVHARML
jgi:hypothetical protein